MKESESGNRFATVKLELTVGEAGLVQRAIRYYIQSEQMSIQNALLAAQSSRRKKDLDHAEDVKRQARAHIGAAEALHGKIRERMLSHEN